MLQAIHSQTSVLPGDITGQVKPQNLEQAAEQFEAMFLRSMMKQMRKASQALVDDNPFDSKQQRMMQEFLRRQAHFSAGIAAQHRHGADDYCAVGAAGERVA